MAYVGSVYSKGLTPIEVQEGKKTPQNVCVVLDGVEQKHFAKIDQLTFSADSKHLAYLAGIDQLASTRVVVDGQEGPAFSSVQQLVISDDGGRSACIATKTIVTKTPSHETASQNSYVVVDNGNEARYEQITHVCVSPDGQHVAYVPQSVQTNTVIVDNEKPSQQYRGCDTLKFSPDSKTELYVAISAGAYCGEWSNMGRSVGSIANWPFSSEGGHWACCVSTGTVMVLLDGKNYRVYQCCVGHIVVSVGYGAAHVEVNHFK